MARRSFYFICALILYSEAGGSYVICDLDATVSSLPRIPCHLTGGLMGPLSHCSIYKDWDSGTNGRLLHWMAEHSLMSVSYYAAPQSVAPGYLLLRTDRLPKYT